MASDKPIITRELIEYLDRLYPDKAPDVMTPDRDIWMDAGSVRVVRHLRSVLEEQEQNVLEN